MTQQIAGPVRGRPPKDPKKLAEYKARMAAWNKVKPAPTSISIVAAPSMPVVHQTDAQILQTVGDRFNLMFQLAHGIAEGNLTGLVISGPGGIGKSYTVQDVCNFAHDNSDVKFETIKGKISAIELYKAMYRNREPKHVLLLDDADAVFSDEDALTILKAGLDSSISRIVSWNTNSKILAGEGVERQFIFKGAIIFLSNLDFDRQVTDKQSKIAMHSRALMTRTHYLNLGLHDSRSLMLWIRHIVSTRQILQAMEISPKDEAAVIEWMEAHRDWLRDLSIRTAIQIGEYLKMDPANWRKMAGMLKLRDDAPVSVKAG